MLSKRESERRLILMVEGLASYKVELAEGAPTTGNHCPASTGVLYSGSAFDKALLNVLGGLGALKKGLSIPEGH